LVEKRRRPQRDLTMALSWFPALEAAAETMRKLADQQEPSPSPGPGYEIGGRHFHPHNEIPRQRGITAGNTGTANEEPKP
jgi:hypothetical protein